MTIPTYADSLVTAKERGVTIELTVLALALETYRRRHGYYPPSLDWLKRVELVEEIPLDPFSGGPLVYRRKSYGFTLYSAGRNRADDGGDENADLLFRVDKRPPERRPWLQKARKEAAARRKRKASRKQKGK